jgi:hypothetical protein
MWKDTSAAWYHNLTCNLPQSGRLSISAPRTSTPWTIHWTAMFSERSMTRRKTAGAWRYYVHLASAFLNPPPGGLSTEETVSPPLRVCVRVCVGQPASSRARKAPVGRGQGRSHANHSHRLPACRINFCHVNGRPEENSDNFTLQFLWNTITWLFHTLTSFSDVYVTTF